MTVGIADPIRMLTFSIMNTNKANNTTRVDRPERAAVAGLQLRNACDYVLESAKKKTGKIAASLQGVSEGIKSIRNASTTFDVICKSVNFAASKLVNPILCVASAVRAFSAKDKKSAILKETGAMGLMFMAERAYKNLFGLGGRSATYQNYKLLNSGGKMLKTFVQTNKVLSKLPSNGVMGIIKGLGFIAVSCAAFAAGGYIGDKVADHTTAKQYAAKKASEAKESQSAKVIYA